MIYHYILSGEVTVAPLEDIIPPPILPLIGAVSVSVGCYRWERRGTSSTFIAAPVRVRSKTMVVISFSTLEDLFATAPVGAWFHTKTTASICTTLYVVESRGALICKAVVAATAGWNSDDGRLSQSKLVTSIELV